MKRGLLLAIFCSAACAMPPTPTNLTALPVWSDHVFLQWNASAGAAGYYVYRDGALIATLGAVTSYHDETPPGQNAIMQAGSKHMWRVQAFDGTGVSGYASVFTGTTDNYGANSLLPCPANPNPVKWTITAVARSANTATITLSSFTSTSGDALTIGGTVTIGSSSRTMPSKDYPLIISGVSVDGGSFDTPAGSVVRMASSNAAALTVTFPSTGNNVSMTSTSGTAQLAQWYEAKINSAWYFCSPVGNASWFNSVYGVSQDGGTAYTNVVHSQISGSKYSVAVGAGPYYWTSAASTSTIDNWMYYTNLRLRGFGFNGTDAYSQTDANPWATHGPSNSGGYNVYGYPTDENGYTAIPSKMNGMVGVKVTLYACGQRSYAAHALKDLMYGSKSSVYTGWRGSMVGDYYDSVWPAYVAGMLMESGYVPTIYWDYIHGVWVDDTDQMRWLAGSPDFTTAPNGHNGANAGWLALVTAPTQTASYFPPNGRVAFFADSTSQTVYTKQALGAYLQSKYATVAALNAAWGSGYTSFGSAGTQVTGEAIGTTNGTSTTYTATLAHAPSPFSVAVYVNGAQKCGDFGTASWGGGGITYPAGAIVCSDTQPNASSYVYSGSVNYATGAITITLQSAPSSGQTITVNYIYGGFGIGSGVLDEDGMTHSWVPVLNGNSQCTADCNPTVLNDLAGFFAQYSAQYFSSTRTVVKQLYPGQLYEGVTTWGGFNTPAPGPALEGGAPYVDVIRLAEMDRAELTAAGLSDYNSRLSYLITNGGDKPWTMWTTAAALGDWLYAGQGVSAFGNQTFINRQADRGTFMGFIADMNATAKSVDGEAHFAGVNWWQLIDSRTEVKDYGLLSMRDNAYDGVEATTSAGTDRYGFPTGCIPINLWNAVTTKPNTTCELSNYGDAIDGIRGAVTQWIPVAVSPSVPRARVAGFRGAMR